MIAQTYQCLPRLRWKPSALWYFVSALFRHRDEDSPCENLSEVATRNIFSWTFFSDGVRQDELPLWEHEWLSLLLDQDSDDESASVFSD